jgi:hypothetical protein
MFKSLHWIKKLAHLIGGMLTSVHTMLRLDYVSFCLAILAKFRKNKYFLPSRFGEINGEINLCFVIQFRYFVSAKYFFPGKP